MWYPRWGMFDCPNCRCEMSTRGFLDLVGPTDKPVGITVRRCAEHLAMRFEADSSFVTSLPSPNHPDWPDESAPS